LRNFWILMVGIACQKKRDFDGMITNQYRTLNRQPKLSRNFSLQESLVLLGQRRIELAAYLSEKPPNFC